MSTDLPKLLLTWKREANEQGLSSIGQAERGWELRLNGRRIASVSPLSGGRRWETVGWFFSASENAELGTDLANSAQRGVKTPAEALAQAERHFLTALASKYRVTIRRPRGMGKAVTLLGEST